MPNLFSTFGYQIYFWSNENNEPIHVHVSKGKPSKHSTKIWLTSNGGCVLANNRSKIGGRDLNKLMDVIAAQYDYICESWIVYFDDKNLRFYV
jgi:hypothetical protein